MSDDSGDEISVAQAAGILRCMKIDQDETTAQFHQDRLLDSPLPSDDDDAENEATMFDRIVSLRGDRGVRVCTNLSIAAFNEVWDVVSDEVVRVFTEGRGRKYRDSPKDLFFMMLCVLKSNNHWDYQAEMFQRETSSFERSIVKMIVTVEPLLYKAFVIDEQVRADMASLEGNQFEYFSQALYATDVNFQQAGRPGTQWDVSKEYFSKKHGLYGYKTEASVLPSGLAIDVTDHAKGATSDITIFKENIDFHKNQIRKDGDDLMIHDPVKDEPEQQHTTWAILFDKGYQGAQKRLRAILPIKKKRRNIPLRRSKKIYNQKVAHDRVIVENFFGRRILLWGIMRGKFRFSESMYDTYVRLSTALTNFHIKNWPLRDVDNDMYQSARKSLYEKGRAAQEQKGA